ncbi:hypothetical protein JCM10207_005397, partial [Rhodosporidiobolus poonsookiae]
ALILALTCIWQGCTKFTLNSVYAAKTAPPLIRGALVMQGSFSSSAPIVASLDRVWHNNGHGF